MVSAMATERETREACSLERERESLGGETERLMIERQELVETGGGHMGGGSHF